MLRLSGLNVYYGKSMALADVTLEVGEKEVVSLLGANGAGKSTTLRTISGLVPAKSGDMVFLGERINGLPPHKIVKRGISHCPEGRRIFPDLTVYENLVMMGAYLRSDKKEVLKSLENIYGLFPRLKERRNQKGGTLSGGEQQMLAIGRALMARNKFLILDEMSLGLSPLLVKAIFKVLLQINKAGISIFNVEQNVPMTLKTAHRAYILESGHIVGQGEAKALLKSPHVKQAYLGIS